MKDSDTEEELIEAFKDDGRVMTVLENMFDEVEADGSGATDFAKFQSHWARKMKDMGVEAAIDKENCKAAEAKAAARASAKNNPKKDGP